jgi:23S rRNA (cytosine1962-C5)-methyltransferase
MGFDDVLRVELHRRRERLPPHTDAFRWLDGEIPGATIDLFGEVAILSVYEVFSTEEEQALASAALEIAGLRAVYVKRRPREAARLAHDAADFVAPKLPLAGSAAPPFLASEGGTRYEIRADNGLSVGLYLDARDARAWVRRQARARRVLNLFSYTCGFGVVALQGGAARALNIDVSRRVLDWGVANLEHNGLAASPRDFIAGDVFEWLHRLAKKAERFDLLIIDPPGFATTRRHRFSAARDYASLVQSAAPLVAPGGLLLALCNVEALSAKDFEAGVRAGLAPRRHRVAARFGASPVDFREPSALKCLALELQAASATSARAP